MNQIVFNNEKVTPSKVVYFNPQTQNISSKENEAITSILHTVDENTKFKSKISLLVEDEKIIGIGLGLDIIKGAQESAVFSDFVKFDGEIKNLRHNLRINDELIQESSLEDISFQDIIRTIKENISLQNTNIIMLGINKGASLYEECDLFMGDVYFNDEILAEACWEAV